MSARYIGWPAQRNNQRSITYSKALTDMPLHIASASAFTNSTAHLQVMGQLRNKMVWALAALLHTFIASQSAASQANFHNFAMQ
jgi:hypothetical protein